MAENIQPGSVVSVKVVNQPTNEAARKTIVRVLSKSARAKTEDARLTRIRQSGHNPTPRGGRLYGGRLVKQHPLKGAVGEQETITATLDVLRDLASVQRFVEVVPA